MFAAWFCLIAAEAGLPLGEYSPLEVKMSVVGYGRAEKQQVQMMVRSILQIDTEMAITRRFGCARCRHLPRHQGALYRGH